MMGGMTSCRAIAALLVAVLLGGSAPPTSAPIETVVEVERARPQPEAHATLRFLKSNRDFIRGRLDLLRQRALARRGESAEIDARWLAYQRMLADIHAARDTVGAAETALRRLQLLESVTQLGRLEAQLDLMDRQLAEQRARLGVLQDDFAGDQRTALMVVLRGHPHEVALTEIAITIADGATVRVPLTSEQRGALERGGVVEIFHGFVEPREQVIEVTVTGAPWPTGESAFIRLEPARDHLTFLKLDLSALAPGRAGTGIRASTWLHDGEMRSAGG
jgi:hypothetical protein